MSRVLVTGAGGFIGGHMVHDLVRQGHDVIATDIKPSEEWSNICDGVVWNIPSSDLNDQATCESIVAFAQL